MDKFDDRTSEHRTPRASAGSRPQLATSGVPGGRRGRREKVPSTFAPEATPHGILLWCVDGGFLAAVLVLPFIMGGRQAIGEYALILIACWTMLAWCLHHATRQAGRWRWSGMEPLLLAGIAVCTLQTIHLSPQLVHTLSPRIARLLPVWQVTGDDASLSLLPGPWTTLSLAPAETLSSLCCVIAIAMLFVVAVQRIDSLQDARLLMRLIALSATLMAVFGIVQFLFGNGRFFWFYDHPFTHTRDYAKGAFTNPNHFADFLAMSVPILLAWYAMEARSGNDRPRNPFPSLSERLAQRSGALVLGCLAVVSLGVLLSQSRGGLVTACLGAMMTLALLLRQRLLTMKAAMTIGGIALGALISLTFFGKHIQGLIEHNFHELVSGDKTQLDRGDARQKIWAAALRGISDYPLFGTGLSTHREVYWTYFDHPEIEGEYSHAENGYLQVALETGLSGLGLAVACALLVGWWCLRGLSRRTSAEGGALLAAIVGAFAVNLVHSITDFIWYAPAIMTAIALLAACACRLNQLSLPRSGRSAAPRPGRVRWGAVAAAGGVVSLAGWMLTIKHPALEAEPLWFDYIRMVKGEEQLHDEFDRAEYQQHKLSTLCAAADRDPSNARIQMRAATAALTLFRKEREASPNNMSLAHIREAARASQWESKEQFQAWLNAPGVIGDRTRLDEAWNRALHALSLCPLLAEGYVRLGELAWLRSASRKQEDALLVQALLVRPYDPLVHFAAGREAWLRNLEDAALAHWGRAFSKNGEYQQLIIDLLAPVVTAEYFLEKFEPDTRALARLQVAFQNVPDPQSYEMVTRLLAERLAVDAAAAQHHDAVRLWRQAHEACVIIGDADGATHAAEAAVDADPNSLPARRLLGQWLFQTQQYAAAREHLKFCVLRRPQDASLRRMLEIANQNAHVSVPRVAAESPAGSPGISR